jgi:hypothetical protein
LNAVGKHLRLVRLMISEELRLNASMIGRIQFLLFPAMILVFSLILALASEQLLVATSLDQMYVILHVLIFAYGLGVGGFALFGERIATRRFGQVSLLLQTPTLLPVSFRTIFLAFYVKDIIYYILYTIVPLVAGIALSIPITGFRVSSVLFLLLTLTLSFLLGISLSFSLSSIYVRWKWGFVALLGAVGALLAAAYLGDWFDITQLLPSLDLQRTADPIYLLISAVLVVGLSAFAVLTLKIRFGSVSRLYDVEMLHTSRSFKFAGGAGKLMAKDWIDLKRSRTLGAVAGAYVGPLLFLALLFWFVEGIMRVDIPINLIFYSAMIGFFSVSIYGWLNMLDAPAFLEVLPVRVSEMVRTKVLLLSLFALVLSTIFLIGLGIARSELDILPLALLVGYSSTAFIVCGTAYLTGLRTNSYLFDPRILAKFGLLCIPPLIAFVLLSFNYRADTGLFGTVIAGLCALLLCVAYLLYRGIERKWGRESFSF